MIKKLRWRFIFFGTLSVVIVLTLILTTINLVAYVNITNQADAILEVLKENNGEFPIEFFEKREPDRYINKETPFETRYFVVDYNFYTETVQVNIKKIAEVLVEDALYYADHIHEKNTTAGYIDDFRYLKVQTDTGVKIIFVDCTKSLGTLKFVFLSSCLIFVLATLTVFLLLFLLSPRIIKPTVDAYTKQKKFITNAGHELKTPLTVITANTELLEMENGENEYTKSISKQVGKLVSMTNSLIMLSKIDEKSAIVEKVNFSLTEAIYDIITEYEKVLIQEFTYQIDEDIVYCGDEKLIRELLVILIDNAKKYSQSKINLSITKNKNQIALKIENDTTGIPKGNLNQFTERFYRTDEIRASGIEGSGIGLSVASEIVSLHKGTLKLYSDDGINFVVEVIL